MRCGSADGVLVLGDGMSLVRLVTGCQPAVMIDCQWHRIQ